ncbi:MULTISPECIES: tRNA glutamyl-Q(34) synthetase GluQRS [unclassified Ruegeria]|uniref:tRNA glutamyl-Q(34) synthetase GluQRS n=1 Tax=unclassified Ruegeria TaxID=2625375 RepID=UPI00149243D2|nr:tRNA glutamyl-Q(34) synthetase GluQRS [Ruegeria sp. HKCCD4318]NOE12998.1 tRNA glutamyl-Q(34) synthetase GluQRS [Ruegeria sp. HKCCD4318-2]NOG08835.1 tRNA glutamyl-Q(34) synthetase GluQRS [Ruegeria sp. HKCCD4315]
MIFLTRFAPSPTGPLHLGHAYSALLASDMATAESGQFLLRIEDIDQSRSRQHWEDQIYDDLTWLGLTWPKPVVRQSDRMGVYDQALDRLWGQGFLFPCTCNRKDIAAAASAPQEGAPIHGPDGIIYPGTCRKAHHNKDLSQHPRPRNEPLRLDIAKACQAINDRSRFQFIELGSGPDGETGTITFTPDELINTIGDVVLSRRDMGTSYHLSVVLDDAAQGITHVVRGRDLFEATRIHVLLQALLDLPTPAYLHHDLIRDEAGKRLAKRDDARAISKYRAEGHSPADIRRMVGL